MENDRTHYEVALEECKPKFASERRYVAAELDYVRRQVTQARTWWSWPSAGIYRRRDWQQYQRQLEHYAHAMDRHEQEMVDGWLPFKIHIMNAGPHGDTHVSVKMIVEDGSISEHKKVPARPQRLDGRNRIRALKLPRFQGFVRSGVKVRRHDMCATFSKLDAGDSADLVRETLYLHHNPRTALHFELNSQLVKNLTSELRL